MMKMQIIREVILPIMPLKLFQKVVIILAEIINFIFQTSKNKTDFQVDQDTAK